MDKKYAHIGHPAIKLCEECGELIKAVSKIERFGVQSHHPNRQTTNLEELINEWADLEARFKEYLIYIKEQ